MKQIAGRFGVIAEITFIATSDPGVAVTVTSPTGRCAMLLDLSEINELIAEALEATRVAFGERKPE